MKVYYSMVIQMRGTYAVDDPTMELAARYLRFGKHDVEEVEVHNAQIIFTSSIKPSEMKERILRLLVECRTIYYIDVVYRFEHEMIPDRFVVWQGGKIKDYTGKVTFVEDDAE